MSKLITAAIAAIATFCTVLPLQAEDGRTTRIETRPFYGATVTIEAGVRVFRPLPTTKHVIINPNGDTPLALGFNETRVYKNSRSYNYHRHQHTGGHSGYGRGSYFPGGRIGRIGVGH